MKLKEAKVIEVYTANGSAEVTARELGTTRRRVARLLKKAGVYKPRTIRLDKDTEEAIITRWLDGESQCSLARAYNLTQCWVGKFLRRKGVLTSPVKMGGADHPSWKGGRQYCGGYVRVPLSKDDPLGSMTSPSDSYVLEHRLVMARHLGRPLRKEETVHHKNGIKDDNRLDNLQLRQGRHGKGVVCRCADCGSINIIQEEI